MRQLSTAACVPSCSGFNRPVVCPSQLGGKNESLFFYGSYNDAFSSSEYVASNCISFICSSFNDAVRCGRKVSRRNLRYYLSVRLEGRSKATSKYSTRHNHRCKNLKSYKDNRSQSDSRCSPEYKSEAPILDPTFSVSNCSVIRWMNRQGYGRRCSRNSVRQYSDFVLRDIGKPHGTSVPIGEPRFKLTIVKC
jgi:hypothetical protein